MSAGPEARPKGRVRRAREAVRGASIQQVKLTEEERDQLRARAAELGVSVPRLMVESALSGVETPTERRRMDRGAVRGPAAAGDGGEQRQPARPGRRTSPGRCARASGWSRRSPRSTSSSRSCGELTGVRR